MKNILLATTGLFGAALLATAASAQTPKVTIGGFADFEAGFTSDDNDDNTRSQGFRNDTEITIHVDGKTEGGLGYGAVIDIEADVTADANDQGGNAARTFIYFEGDWGRTELGSNRGAAATQRIDASTIAAASGGINGSWVYFVNNLAGSGAIGAANTVSFISTSKLPTEHGNTLLFGDESTYNANKISYYTPRFSGFQAGVSYTPDLNDRGQTLTRIDSVAAPTGGLAGGAGQYGDIIEAGVNFETQLDDGISLALSLTGEVGQADDDNTAPVVEFEDLQAYAIGAVIGFEGWSLAGSYGDWDDSGATVGGVAGTIDSSDYYTVGLAYDGGAYAVSATYLDSTVDLVGGGSNDFNNLVLGADYKLAPGLTPYAEVAFYEFDEDGPAGPGIFDNDGTTFIVGTQVAF
jgi:hypothetical protein